MIRLKLYTSVLNTDSCGDYRRGVSRLSPPNGLERNISAFFLILLYLLSCFLIFFSLSIFCPQFVPLSRLWLHHWTFVIQLSIGLSISFPIELSTGLAQLCKLRGQKWVPHPRHSVLLPWIQTLISEKPRNCSKFHIFTKIVNF